MHGVAVTPFGNSYAVFEFLSCIFSARLYPSCFLQTTYDCCENTDFSIAVVLTVSCCATRLWIYISEPCSEIEMHSHCRGGTNLVWVTRFVACPLEAAQMHCGHRRSALTRCEQAGHSDADRTEDSGQRLGKKLLSALTVLRLGSHPPHTCTLLPPAPVLA